MNSNTRDALCECLDEIRNFASLVAVGASEAVQSQKDDLIGKICDLQDALRKDDTIP